MHLQLHNYIIVLVRIFELSVIVIEFGKILELSKKIKNI